MSIYLLFSVVSWIWLCEYGLTHSLCDYRAWHGEQNLVHSNSSLNGNGRTSYEFLLKYRTELKLLLKTNHKDQVDPNSIQREGLWYYFSLVVWGFFLVNNGLPLLVYISVGVQQYLHNILFVYTQSEKYGNLQTMYCVNYSRCFAYLCIWAAWTKLKE